MAVRKQHSRQSLKHITINIDNLDTTFHLNGFITKSEMKNTINKIKRGKIKIDNLKFINFLIGENDKVEPIKETWNLRLL